MQITILIKVAQRLKDILLIIISIGLAVDSLWQFIPIWLSIPVGGILIFIMIRKFQPEFITPFHAVTGLTPVQRKINAFAGCGGYLCLSIFKPYQDYPYYILYAGCVILIIFYSIKYSRRFTEDELLKVWSSIIGNKLATKEWKETTELPNSIIRRIYMFTWRYALSFTAALTACMIGVICGMLTLASTLFAAILLVWLIAYIVKVIVKKRKIKAIKTFSTPDVQDGIAKAYLGSNIFDSLKGVNPILYFITGSGVACGYIAFSFNTGSFLSIMVPGSVSGYNIDVYILAGVLLPSACYQLYFWYRLLRRFPSFLEVWKTGNSAKVETTYSLPKVVIVTFILSCFTPLTAFLIIYIDHYLVFISMLFTIIFIALIWYSNKNNTEKIQAKSLIWDNLLIPVATHSAVFGFLLFDLLLSANSYERQSLMTTMPAELISGLLFLLVFFYCMDIYLWSKKKYGETLKGDLLSHTYYVLFIIAFLPVALASSDHSSRIIGMFTIGLLCIVILIESINAFKKNKPARDRKNQDI